MYVYSTLEALARMHYNCTSQFSSGLTKHKATELLLPCDAGMVYTAALCVRLSVTGLSSLQCSDAVSMVTRKASGLQKSVPRIYYLLVLVLCISASVL